MKCDVCVRGAGLVGQVTALLLAKQGLKVVLVLPNTPPAHPKKDIRSYAINAASKTLLEALKCWPDSEYSCGVQHMRVFGDDAGKLHFHSDVASQSNTNPTHTLNHIVDASTLEACTTQAIRYQNNLQCLTVDEANEQLLPSKNRLTIICEGGHSNSRDKLDIEYTSTDYEQTAIAAQLTYTEGEAHTAYQWFDRGEILALLPRNFSEPDDDASPTCNFSLIWSAHRSYANNHAAELLALSPEELAREIEKFIGAPSDSVTIQSPISSWPLRLAEAQRWLGSYPDGSTWVLAGDAAHSMHPLAGQGLNCGLADAACLAKTIENRPYFRNHTDLRLLRAYERERKAGWEDLKIVTDGLQQLFIPQNSRIQALRNWGMSGANRTGFIKNWLIQKATKTST